MKLFSRLLSSTSVIAFALASAIPFFTSAESAESMSSQSVSIENNLTTGDGIWQPAEETGAKRLDQSIVPAGAFPSAADSSNSVYFPPIGNQGEMNSCAGWATTYYQYTYELNKFLGIATTADNIYSPSWTYNYINGGMNEPTSLGAAYDILKNHGAMKLKDYSYSEKKSTYSYAWSTDTQKMVDALKYRIDYQAIDCRSSYDLYYAKSKLSNGKIGVIWTNSLGWTKEKTSTGETIIIRGSKSTSPLDDGGHFMTVVGYDDDITTTYNNVTMKGAFKLANSWGTENTWSDGNDGYIWVAYDALNDSSAFGDSWQSGMKSVRSQIFGPNNQMYFIEIEPYNVYYVGKLTYITDDPWHTNVYGDIGPYATFSKFFPSLYPIKNPSNLQNPEYRVMVFDYFNSPYLNPGDYIKSQFTTEISNYTTNNTYRIYLSVIDNRCKTILPNDTVVGSLSSGSYSRTFNLNLRKGRISSYDNGNVSSADVSLLSSYLLGSTTMSSLQSYLADMNDDKVLDIFDLILIQQAQNNNNSENVLNAYIPELGSTIEEYILSQYDENVLEIAEDLLAS